LVKGFAFFMHFFDEIEQHDDVADNDADQTGDSQKRHESKWRSHQRKTQQSAHDTIWSGCEHQKRLNSVAELQQQCTINSQQRDHEDLRQIRESILLLGLLASDFHTIAGWHRLLELGELWDRLPQNL